jgi:hypothetical protein
MKELPREIVIAVGRRLHRIAFGDGPTDGQNAVTVSGDGSEELTFLQPSWCPMSVGVGDGRVHLWWARSIVLLPESTGSPPSVIHVDEDLLSVFTVPHGWLFVCETSVRLLDGSTEIDRVEADDVIDRADWMSATLLAVRTGRSVYHIAVDGTHLRVHGG